MHEVGGGDVVLVDDLQDVAGIAIEELGRMVELAAQRRGADLAGDVAEVQLAVRGLDRVDRDRPVRVAMRVVRVEQQRADPGRGAGR